MPPSRRCHCEELSCRSRCLRRCSSSGSTGPPTVHAVCVMDAAGKILSQFTIEHSADGIAMLVRRLAKLADPADVPVAIERPNGRLVDLLLEAGHPVVPVKPNAIKTWREGEVLSGAKSDTGDAAVIAEYLRLRQHRLRTATPYSSETKALRTVVRTRDDLVEMRVAATNQLAALLDAHWPGAKAIFADIESPIALAFLTRYPTAAAARPPRRKAPGRIPASSTATPAAARPPNCSPGCARHPAGTARRHPHRSDPRCRAGPRRRPDRPRRAPSRTSDRSRRRPPRGAPGRRDLHVAAKVGSDQRRPDARRVGRLPPSLRESRLRRRPRRRAPRSPRNPANTTPCTSAGPATNASARP